MKYWLIIILGLCVVPFTFGASTQTQVLYSTDSVNFEGYNIYIEANIDYTTIRVQIDDYVDFINTGFDENEMDQFLFSNGELEYDPKPQVSNGLLTVRLQEICGNISKKDCARTNPNTLWIEPAYKLLLEYEAPDVSVERTLSESSVWLDEDITLTTTITNDGDFEITDLKLFESFPFGITIERSAGWEVVGNQYVYTIDSLGAKDSIDVDITFSLSSAEEYVLKGTYEYYSSGVKEVQTSSSVDISLKTIYDVSFDLDKSEYLLDDVGEASLVITPQLDEDILVDLEIQIPSGVTVSSRDFDRLNNRLQKTILVSDEDEVTFDLEFEGLDGEYEFIVLHNATFIERLPVSVIEREFTFGNPDPEDLDVEIVFSEENILEGESVTVELFLSGPDSTDFSDIVLNVSQGNSSNISESFFVVSELLDGSFDNIFFTYIPFILNDTRSESIDVHLSYMQRRDGKEEVVNSTISENVLVYIPQDALKVTRSVSPNPVKQNETALVTVQIENLLDERQFELYAKDTVPEELLTRDVKKESEVYLRGGETKLLYSYELLMPFYIENSSTLSTLIVSENFRFEDSTFLDSVVTLEEPSLDVSSSWSSVVVGKPSQLEILLRNNGDLTMSSSSFLAPLFQQMDLLSNRRVEVPRLEPGESVTFFFEYIPKLSGQGDSYIEGIFAYDEYGNSFSLTDEDISVDIDEGVGCGLIGSVLSDSKNNDSYSMRLVLSNTCDSTVDVSITDPSLFVPISPGESRTIQFTEVLRDKTFSGITFSYTKGSKEHFSITNSLDLTDVVEEETLTSEPSSNSGSSSNSPAVPDSEQILLEDGFIVSGIWQKVLGVLGVIILVFVLMGVLLRFAQKKSKADTPKENPLDAIDDSLVPPSIKEGMEQVGLFVDESIKRGVPITRIEEQLHYVGWSKEIIDRYVVKK